MLQSLQQEINKNRIFGLDVLRCLAILMVLVEHGMLILKPVVEYLDWMKLGGYWGVELFFVLSGFLIGGILLKNHEEQENFTTKSLWKFWKRRWFRTLPNYYLILLLNLGFVFCGASVVGGATTIYWEYFFFAQSVSSPHPSFFGEAWSLVVEEWFYLTFPLLLFGVNRLFVVVKTKKNKFLMSILMLFVVVVAWRWTQVLAYNPHWDEGVRKVMVFRLDAILTGVLVAWGNYYYPLLLQQYKNILLLFSIGLLGLSFYGFYEGILGGGYASTSFYYKTLYFNLTSIGFACCLPYANAVEQREGLSNLAKGITLVSIVSYSMYLLHLSVVWRLVVRLLQWNTSIWTAILFYGIYLFLTVFLSVLLYCFFEKPMMDWRDRV